METAKGERLRHLLNRLKDDGRIYNESDFAKKTAIGKSFLSDMKACRKDLAEQTVLKMKIVFPDINQDWLLTGEGEMLKNSKKENPAPHSSGNLIPLYNDVASIGGNSELSANMDGITEASEYIDTGDWFRDATAAIRHYGDSMIEYPNGCILALRQISDRALLVPGRDYMVETTEFRVTKRIQLCTEDNNCYMLYSTNIETYPDGKQVHEPFKVEKKEIRRISLVLGYVVKKNGGTMVFNSGGE